MKLSWSLASSTIDGLVEQAQLCEAVELDGVWYPDYQAPFSDCPELYVSLASLVSCTRRLFIGSLVTDVLRRHPMVTAHAFASLSHNAKNRIILGLGAGAGSSHLCYGIELDHLAKKLEEGIQAVKSLWTATPEKPVTFNGRYFKLKKAGTPVRPVGNIPIYVASYGPRMIEVTAKFADGWIPESHSPTTYQVTLENIYARMKTYKRRRDKLEPCLAAIFYPFEPNSKAYENILNGAKHYLATYPDIQWSAGMGKDHPGWRTQQLMSKQSSWDELAEKVPDSLADSTIIYGRAEQCIDRIAKFADAGCVHMIFEPYWIEQDKVNKALEIAGAKIKSGIQSA